MRSLLAVTASDPAAIEAAIASDADALLIDVDVAAAILARKGGSRIYVRIAALDDPRAMTDMSNAVAAKPCGLALSQANGRTDVQRLSARLAVEEAHAGLPEGALRILAFAGETPDAIFNLSTYSSASPRLEALVASLAPLAVALRTTPRASQAVLGGALRLARDLTLIAARAAGGLALEGPFANVDDIAGLRAEALVAWADGFDGKVAIDVAQVAVINEVFARGLMS